MHRKSYPFYVFCFKSGRYRDVRAQLVRAGGGRSATVSRPRLLLADGEALVLEAFGSLLRNEGKVVGMVTDGRSVLPECQRLQPDIVILDVAMPVLNGLDAGRLLREQCPSVNLIYLTMNADARVAAEAVRLGALGYVLKSGSSAELKLAIAAAAKGRPYITPVLADVVGSLLGWTRAPLGLTARQREVLHLLAEGRSMKEVAQLLHVTPRTVAFHKYKMMGELRVKTTAELVHFAVKQGVVG
jgi:DNA-binding NarL/FixJ family response regulator